jgi:trehalose/maltose hydrolase-like predicted phosphorylase
MACPSLLFDEDAVDRTFAAVVVAAGVDLDAQSDVIRLLQSLAARDVVVSVLHEPLARTLRSLLCPGPGERYLITVDGASTVFELTERGSRRLSPPDRHGPNDALGLVLTQLKADGIGPGITLVVGGAPGPIPERAVQVGSEADVPALLRNQIDRRDGRRVPHVDLDPSWTLTFGLDQPMPQVREALCTLANGRIGTRGSAEDEPPDSDPLLLAAGVYDDQSPPSLLEGPRWTRLTLDTAKPESDQWTLDLRTGVLTRRLDTESGRLTTFRFVSLARRHCVVLRAEGPEGVIARGRPLADTAITDSNEVTTANVTSSRGGIATAATEKTLNRHGIHTLDRIAAYEIGVDPAPNVELARASVRELADLGCDHLLAEHRAAWARRWSDAEVTIEGDPKTELAVRFALFHLISSAAPDGEAAVGARGLTGRAYRGHVFWDTDVYVLPALAGTFPEAARAILEYRIARLPAARQEARRHDGAGARFPWESADVGSDVTPRRFTSPEGNTIPIRTGHHEEHIVADVAWAARHYARWSGDEQFLAGPGRDLLLETARYWTSQIRMDPDGRGHLLGMIGPDEYHQVVDDNAYTNVMARANLRWAAEHARRHGGADSREILAWWNLADCLVDGYNPGTGLYEQFAGYHKLEPLLIEDVATPPIAADLLLGRDRVARTQLIKQPDVLMLHHVVPEEVVPDSLIPNLAHYLPRTAHGSSLSPAIHASLLARAGRLKEALHWFRIAARMDLDDLTGTTAGGLHLATMGGLWQALALGFLGLSVDSPVIALDPKIPENWRAVSLRLVALGSRLSISASPEEIDIESDRPLRFACGQARIQSPTLQARFIRREDQWKEI